jgi:aminocarboxymuconate-semialdehyde decarboxylase
MSTRRDFFKTVAGAAAGAFVVGGALNGARAAAQAPASGRRQVSIGGRRIRVVDIHAHCTVPEVGPIVQGTKFQNQGGNGGARALNQARYDLIDKQGIDLQVLSINGHWWYDADRELAARIVGAQNEGLAKWVSGNSARFDAFASVALQFPDLAAQQLDDAVKRLRLRGAAIGGHALNEDLSLPKFDPFWAKAAELGVPVLVHPGGAENIIKPDALEGRADLGNIIGNPLETTYLFSRLIFDGTLDKHPGIHVIGVHAGGYLPSYLGRTDVACKVRNNANCANKRDPRDYFKRELHIDTMVLSEEGLRHLVAEVGAGQIMFGTDNPLNWPVPIDLVLNAPFLSNADKEAILGGNALKLLRITS